MDDDIPVKPRRSRSEDSEPRKVINVEASLVEEVNEYAEDLEEKLGFRPTFSQTLRFIVKELRKK